MAIVHLFHTPTSDGPDGSVVRPSNWNEPHLVESNTLAAPTLALSTPQRVLGRDTAGAGPGEEVTAAQLLDWVSNTNGVLLTRAGGTWGTAANVGIDGGDLVLATRSQAPAAAPGGKVRPFAFGLAGKSLLAIADPDGRIHALQSHLARTHVGTWVPAGGNTVTASGIVLLNTGTATSRNPAATNLFTSTIRVGWVSATTAAAAAGPRSNIAQFWRGDQAGLGGFLFVIRFGVSDAALVATANMFVGLTAATAAPADAAPSSLANVLGVGCDAGDTQLQLYAAGGTAQARTSLGANFPVNTTSADLYELVLHCPPNAGAVQYLVTRVNTGHTAGGTISAAANLPAPSTFLAAHVYRSNGGTAAAVGVDLASLYVETGGW